MRRILAAAAALLAVMAPAAGAATTTKKAIWGPVQVGGVSQFETYERLGVGLWQTQLHWAAVAPERPAEPRDPADQAYRWPAELDTAVREGRAHGVQVVLQILSTPTWANGGRQPAWAPLRAADYADFLTAAARRYPAVRHWMVWGEPTRYDRFRPMGARSRRGPRRYARILDAAYARLKSLSPRNLVIGGNTFTVGVPPPLDFIRRLRLPGGRPPRMDLYGHNPFSLRRPDLRHQSLGSGHADFGDLDVLARTIDRNLGSPGGRRIRLFLSEYCVPTDHENAEFNFWVTREVQARWLADALRITRRWKRIYSLGTFLYDDAPVPDGREVNRGLLTWDGREKPSFAAMRDG